MKWYNRLYNLQFITRYSNVPRVRDENVAQHSFFVAALCLEIMDELDLEVDKYKVLTMAIIHDWAEAEIDDIAHNIKRDYPSVRKALKSAEKNAMKIYPKHIQNMFLEYEDGKTIESVIVKLADVMQCVQYLESEIDLGNRYMQPLLEESRESVINLKIRLYNFE